MPLDSQVIEAILAARSGVLDGTFPYHEFPGDPTIRVYTLQPVHSGLVTGRAARIIVEVDASQNSETVETIRHFCEKQEGLQAATLEVSQTDFTRLAVLPS